MHENTVAVLVARYLKANHYDQVHENQQQHIARLLTASDARSILERDPTSGRGCNHEIWRLDSRKSCRGKESIRHITSV